ncbi:hypothetical protein DM01DRAFT_1340814 [Hesseltinella vesiculosa]|uniref:Uncharacterized protein n=1 Tax=Hesseltinella vesiculosa TaxID=101127 RepID=A0A1X2G2W3_9FUNG|nr:hypothetical protein DM01DRAFT_1340814 [Hesseltinella vesiculosa]
MSFWTLLVGTPTWTKHLKVNKDCDWPDVQDKIEETTGMILPALYYLDDEQQIQTVSTDAELALLKKHSPSVSYGNPTLRLFTMPDPDRHVYEPFEETYASALAQVGSLVDAYKDGMNHPHNNNEVMRTLHHVVELLFIHNALTVDLDALRKELDWLSSMDKKGKLGYVQVQPVLHRCYDDKHDPSPLEFHQPFPSHPPPAFAHPQYHSHHQRREDLDEPSSSSGSTATASNSKRVVDPHRPPSTHDTEPPSYEQLVSSSMIVPALSPPGPSSTKDKKKMRKKKKSSSHYPIQPAQYDPDALEWCQWPHPPLSYPMTPFDQPCPFLPPSQDPFLAMMSPPPGSSSSSKHPAYPPLPDHSFSANMDTPLDSSSAAAMASHDPLAAAPPPVGPSSLPLPPNHQHQPSAVFMHPAPFPPVPVPMPPMPHGRASRWWKRHHPNGNLPPPPPPPPPPSAAMMLGTPTMLSPIPSLYMPTPPFAYPPPHSHYYANTGDAHGLLRDQNDASPDGLDGQDDQWTDALDPKDHLASTNPYLQPTMYEDNDDQLARKHLQHHDLMHASGEFAPYYPEDELQDQPWRRKDMALEHSRREMERRHKQPTPAHSKEKGKQPATSLDDAVLSPTGMSSTLSSPDSLNDLLPVSAPSSRHSSFSYLYDPAPASVQPQQHLSQLFKHLSTE